MGDPQNLINRLGRAAFVLFVSAGLAFYAWVHFLRPLLPVLLFAAVLIVVGRLWLRRWRM